MAKRQLPRQTKNEPSWTVTISTRKLKDWGYCSYGRRAIVLSKDVEPRGVDRQVFLHELIHKALPWMAEDAVDHLATELDDGLDVMGM